MTDANAPVPGDPGPLAGTAFFRPGFTQGDQRQLIVALSRLGAEVATRPAPLTRSIPDLAWAILINIPLQGFFAALGAKPADAAYAALKAATRSLLGHWQHATPAAVMVLQDPHTGLLIEITGDLPEAAWEQLRALDLTTFTFGPLRYDRSARRWRSELDEDPQF